jgi:hypothetical protein
VTITPKSFSEFETPSSCPPGMAFFRAIQPLKKDEPKPFKGRSQGIMSKIPAGVNCDGKIRLDLKVGIDKILPKVTIPWFRYSIIPASKLSRPSDKLRLPYYRS